MAGEGEFPKSDGDVLYSADVNNLRIRRKQFSDTTESTHTGNTDWVDTNTNFTFEAPVNSLILGVYVTCQINSNGSGWNTQQASMNLKFTGTNLGTKYLIGGINYNSRILVDWQDNDTKRSAVAKMPYWADTENALITVFSNGYANSAASGMTPLKVLDSSTTITVRQRISDSTKTAGIKNIIVDIIYVPQFKEDS